MGEGEIGAGQRLLATGIFLSFEPRRPVRWIQRKLMDREGKKILLELITGLKGWKGGGKKRGKGLLSSYPFLFGFLILATAHRVRT